LLGKIIGATKQQTQAKINLEKDIEKWKEEHKSLTAKVAVRILRQKAIEFD